MHETVRESFDVPDLSASADAGFFCFAAAAELCKSDIKQRSKIYFQ